MNQNKEYEPKGIFIDTIRKYQESEELVREIKEQKDLEILKRWLKLAAKASSIEEFEY